MHSDPDPCPPPYPVNRATILVVLREFLGMLECRLSRADWYENEDIETGATGKEIRKGGMTLDRVVQGLLARGKEVNTDDLTEVADAIVRLFDLAGLREAMCIEIDKCRREHDSGAG